MDKHNEDTDNSEGVIENSITTTQWKPAIIVFFTH